MILNTVIAVVVVSSPPSSPSSPSSSDRSQSGTYPAALTREAIHVTVSNQPNATVPRS